MSSSIELLAPAGSPSCALAAYEAGADAVYAGLPKFNARERGENFSVEDMRKMIKYAHAHGRKLYVTFNTLVRESELIEAVELLAMLEEMAPDALLVQDLGIIRIAREYFPGLTLHGSTQMGIHNTAGMRIAEKLGLSRVVLERQVTLDELAEIRKNSALELELFVHGALCASLSGQCLFSSVLGGSSGNRGKCKQPCRRRYFSKSGNGFFFSTQDLCGAELIPQFKKLGVSSLKIEGRLRQSDYVSQTVAAYRMLLDAPEEQFGKVLPEARNLLAKGCGRRWSQGFYTAESAEKLIVHDTLGASGILCGTVSELRSNGFIFKTAKRIALGDRMRVQPRSGDEGPTVTITRMFVNDQPVKRATSGDTVTVLCDKPVGYNALVYKIGESPKSYSRELEALPPPRTGLNISVEIRADRISAAVLNAPCSPWESAVALSPAQKHPLSAEDVRKEFAAADSPELELAELHCEIDGEYFMPAPELKRLRREFWAHVKAEVKPETVFKDSAVGLERFRCDYLALKPLYTLPEHLTETVMLKPHGAEPGNRKAVRAAGIYELNKLSNEAVLPDFCPEARLVSVGKAIKLAAESKIRRFRVTSLYGLELLKDQPCEELVVSTPLPVCNSMAALELSKFGATRVMAHIEMERGDMEKLRDKSPIPVELYRYGRPAILTTRAKLPFEGDLKDARGNQFKVVPDRRSGLTRLYEAKVISVPRLPGMYDFYDLSNAHWNSGEPDSFNFDAAWL